MIEEVFGNSLRTKAQLSTVDHSDRSQVSDQSLVTGVLDGDETAFAEIFERYKKPMARVVGRYFRERSDIEEFVQQSFTKAYFSLRKFRGGEDKAFAAWLTRISVNVCYDEFRRRQRKGENLFSEFNSDELDYVETIVDGRQPNVEDSLIASQLAEKILSTVDIRDRIAMALVYTEDYSLDEAAEMIGISASNLKSRLFRCRSFLKKRFGNL